MICSNDVMPLHTVISLTQKLLKLCGCWVGLHCNAGACDAHPPAGARRPLRPSVCRPRAALADRGSRHWEGGILWTRIHYPTDPPGGCLAPTTGRFERRRIEASPHNGPLRASPPPAPVSLAPTGGAGGSRIPGGAPMATTIQRRPGSTIQWRPGSTIQWIRRMNPSIAWSRVADPGVRETPLTRIPGRAALRLGPWVQSPQSA